jgi:hypothetical protein
LGRSLASRCGRGTGRGGRLGLSGRRSSRSRAEEVIQAGCGGRGRRERWGRRRSAKYRFGRGRGGARRRRPARSGALSQVQLAEEIIKQPRRSPSRRARGGTGRGRRLRPGHGSCNAGLSGGRRSGRRSIGGGCFFWRRSNPVALTDDEDCPTLAAPNLDTALGDLVVPDLEARLARGTLCDHRGPGPPVDASIAAA